MNLKVGTLLATMSLASTTSPAVGQSGAADPREPQAIEALERMGVSLRELQNFSVSTSVTYEDVLTSGQKIQYEGTINMKVRRPDGLFVSAVSDREARTIVYDGKTLTLYSPRLGYYATVAAPPTIDKTIAEVSEKLGLEIPLADLFAWGTDPRLLANVQSAFTVGGETITGNKCTHYAVRQKVVDWQIWILDGEKALPCKLVITSTDDPAMPQYTVHYTWSPGQTHPTGTFTFAPAKDDTKIAFKRTDAEGAPANREN